MSSYREVVKQLSGAVDGRLPCHVCSKLTLVATLSEYGARCFECYEAYIRAAPSGPVPTNRSEKFALLSQMRRVLTQPKADAKQWARDLERRELAGEALSIFQRNAWRAALSRNLGDQSPA